MSPTRKQWALAFAEQAHSDYRVYTVFGKQDVPFCHRLHYLQMATEKTAKAHLLRYSPESVEKLTRRHDVLAKFIPLLARQFVSQRGARPSKPQISRSLVLSLKQLGREIELLTPEVARRVGSQVNTEYPWPHGNVVRAPCTFACPQLGILEMRQGLKFLKALDLAINSFLSRESK